MPKTAKELAIEASIIASTTKQSFERHLDECSEQHGETNKRLDNIDKKLDKAASYMLRLLVTVVMSMTAYIFSQI